MKPRYSSIVSKSVFGQGSLTENPNCGIGGTTGPGSGSVYMWATFAYRTSYRLMSRLLGLDAHEPDDDGPDDDGSDELRLLPPRR